MFKSVGSNWTVNILRIAVLMHLTPFVLDELGRDVNGVWVAIVSLTGLLKLLILGVPMATVRYLTAAITKQDYAEANRAVSTCLGMCLALGLGAAVIGLFLFLGFEKGLVTGEEWQGLSDETLSGARIAFLVVVGQIALGFAGRLPYGLFDAHQDFVVRNLIVLGDQLTRWGLTVLLLPTHPSLVLLALVQVACMVVEFIIAMTLAKRRYPKISFSLGSFDRSMIKGVLSFSLFVMVLNLGALLAFRIDALVIAAHLSPAHITDYDIGNKFWEPLLEFLLGIGVVVMPKATQLATQGRIAELRAVFEQWTKIALSIVLFVALYLIVLGPEFLAVWVAPEHETTSGPVLQIIMLSAIAFLPVRGVALPILMGMGKPKGPATAFFVMAVVNVGISIALVEPLGIEGVALGTAIPNVGFAIVLLAMAFRELEVRPADFLGYVGLRAVIGCVPPLAVLFAAKSLDLSSWFGLITAGVASSAVFAATWVLFVFRGDRHVDVLAMVKARLLARRGSAA